MNKKIILLSLLGLLIIPEIAFALFEGLRYGTTGIGFYDRHKELIDFLVFFGFFLGMMWIGAKKFFNEEGQRRPALAVAVTFSLALTIAAIKAGFSVEFLTPFISYFILFFVAGLMFIVLSNLLGLEKWWAKLILLLVIVLVTLLLWGLGSYAFTGSFDFYGLFEGFDLPDWFPTLLKYFFAILAVILLFLLFSMFTDKDSRRGKLLAFLAALALVILFLLFWNNYFDGKLPTDIPKWSKTVLIYFLKILFVILLSWMIITLFDIKNPGGRILVVVLMILLVLLLCVIFADKLGVGGNFKKVNDWFEKQYDALGKKVKGDTQKAETEPAGEDDTPEPTPSPTPTPTEEEEGLTEDGLEAEPLEEEVSGGQTGATTPRTQQRPSQPIYPPEEEESGIDFIWIIFGLLILIPVGTIVYYKWKDRGISKGKKISREQFGQAVNDFMESTSPDAWGSFIESIQEHNRNLNNRRGQRP